MGPGGVGDPASWATLPEGDQKRWEQARRKMNTEVYDRSTELVPCQFLHFGRCNIRHLQVFCVVFFKSLKVYGPVHLIPLLVTPSLITKRYVGCLFGSSDSDTFVDGQQSLCYAI